MDSRHHLPARYQQFLMIALGETVLAVVHLDRPSRPPRDRAGLVVAFLSTVLLWRIYFYRSGQVLAEAVAAAADRLAAGRATGMPMSSWCWASHRRRRLRDRTEHTAGQARTGMARRDPWRSSPVPLRPHPAGTVVFDRLSLRRVVAIAALAVAAGPLYFAPPLTASVVAALVLLAVALADARHAAGRPAEAPSPAH